MKHEIRDHKLFLTAESESDQSLLLELWQHPFITELTRPEFHFMERDERAELVCSEPIQKIYPK